MRLYYLDADGKDIRSWPIGIGREGRRTPTGELRVSELRENPTWRPTKKMRELDPELPAVVPPGPANPLGKYAIRIGWNGYVIHGTNKPAGIGRRVSSGCVRLYDADIKEVFDLAKIGQRVKIIDEPVKVGWDGNALYLEAHPTGDQTDQIEATGRFDPVPPTDLSEIQRRVVEQAGHHNLSRIDWVTFDRVIRERQGVPTLIAR
jgi:L,D-transpeptidase ErfK/SrfK